MARWTAVAAVAATATFARQASAQEDAVHFGCFHDNSADRVLGNLLSSPDMTTEVCLDYCTGLRSEFMATQFGSQCWCSPDGGLDYNRHNAITGEDAVCDINCTGDETETCGGSDTFDLYKLASTSACSGAPVERFEQCGGENWTGSTCCSEGDACIFANRYYAQDNGCMVVLIEAEDLATTGAWRVMRDPDASGGRYIVWEGLSESLNNFSPDEGDVISTVINITTAGTYLFKWRMRQPSGVEKDKGNDSWLYFPDAARFGPVGSNANYGTFVKVFGRALNGEFRYSGTAEEANHAQNEMAIEFTQPGRYTMEIAGRSHGHEIDQIILFGDTLSVDEAAAAGCA